MSIVTVAVVSFMSYALLHVWVEYIFIQVPFTKDGRNCVKSEVSELIRSSRAISHVICLIITDVSGTISAPIISSDVMWKQSLKRRQLLM
jgi:hypothetical protein